MKNISSQSTNIMGGGGGGGRYFYIREVCLLFHCICRNQVQTAKCGQISGAEESIL